MKTEAIRDGKFIIENSFPDATTPEEWDRFAEETSKTMTEIYYENLNKETNKEQI